MDSQATQQDGPRSATRATTEGIDRVIGHREPRMLSLLLNCRCVSINGDVCVHAHGPAELVRWAGVLSNPAAFAWRSTVTGERHLQVCGSSTQDPVHGRVTVVLDGDRHRDMWDALQENDLMCGDEEPIDIERLRRAAMMRRRQEQGVPAA
jgi:hypothetical protein